MIIALIALSVSVLLVISAVENERLRNEIEGLKAEINGRLHSEIEGLKAEYLIPEKSEYKCWIPETNGGDKVVEEFGKLTFKNEWGTTLVRGD